MQDHVHFGAPPKLRPRSAGASRSSLPPNVLDYATSTTSTSTSASAPERLASSVNALKASSSLLLRQRLQSPRPGSAAPQQTPRAPGAASNDGKGVFMKPPMRPKSANAASRQVSRHRMQLVQDPATVLSNQHKDEEMIRQAGSDLTFTKEDVVRPGVESTAVRTPLSSKRPFSAAAVSHRSNVLIPVSQSAEVSSNFLSARTVSGIKRPHSAAASTRYQPFRAREKSTSSLASCLSVVSRASKASRSISASSSRLGHSRGDRLLASTRDHVDNTFVYAVPRHFLEHGLPYDPYDIVPVTHEMLFGSGNINQMQDARWDYYTISRAGYTFHLKIDDFRSTFLSMSDWETQKSQFTKLRSLSTFSRFRYRKVFMSWRQWARGKKREAARENLLSYCYFSYPVLLSGMQEVRKELTRLSKLQLMWDFNGETSSLECFAVANDKFLKARTKELQQITTRIQNILTGVCQVFLGDMAPLHVGFPGHEFALSVRKSSNYHILESYIQCEQGLASAHQQFLQHKHFRSTRFTTSEAAEARNALMLSTLPENAQTEKPRGRAIAPKDELEEIRWTMASIKRRKCKQLTKFMTLVDFLLLEIHSRVIKQSLDLFHGFVLRGANAATIMRLTDHDDLVLAMHQTVKARQKPIQAAGEGSMDPSRITQPRQCTPMTKQQIKAFLHSAWEGKLHCGISASADKEEVTTNSLLPVASMEIKLEALFFSKYADGNMESFSLDDLFFTAENALNELLVLPSYSAANMSIFTTTDNSSTNSSESGNAEIPSRQEHLPSLVEQEVLEISCLGPRPLFTLDVGTSATTEKRGKYRYSICFKPELAALVRILQEIIIGFIEAFRKVPPLLSSQELRSVLDFADDIRALNLHSAFGATASSRPGTASSHKGVAFYSDRRDNDESGVSDDDERFRCPADRLLERMQEDMHYLSVRDDIQDLVHSTLDGAESLAASYSKVLELRQQNESVNFELKARLFRRNEYTLDNMRDDATHFMDQLSALEALRLSTNVEFLHFNMQQLQTELLPSPGRCLDAMRELLPRLAREKCDQFLHYINVSSSKIEKPMTQDLDAFTKYLVNLREVFDEVLDKELDLSFLHDFFGLLSKLKFTVPIETIKAFELCGPEFQALKTHVQEAYANRDADLQIYTPLLAETLAQLARKTNALQSSASDQALAAQSSSCQDARDNAVNLYDEAKLMQEEARRLIRIQEVFEEASSELRPPRKTFEDLNELAVELKLKSELWEAVCEADQHLSVCSIDTIRNVDLDKMGVVANRVDSVVDNVRQCATQLTGDFELERLEKLQATLHGLAPVIRDLRNLHLAERHWSKLEHKMQCSLVPVSVESEEATEVDELESFDAAKSTTSTSNRLDLQVQQLLEVNAVAHATAIRHVSEEASAEAAIADSFMSVVRTWEIQEIPVDARKDRDGRDVYCIGDCVELASLIEESQVLLRVMDLSTYSLVVQERLPELLSDLGHTKESLELLQVCQRKWDYTQRLVSIDFARTFPEQAKLLQKHDTSWRALTLSLSNRSLCLPFGVNTEHRQSLEVILEGFESAAKTLADHLEIKRQVFPAFFQLSDLELATLLSKCRDVGCIPSFLYQCFDNVGRIVFGTRDGFQDILQVTSRVLGEAETIPMGKNLKARGPVEQWLAAVDKRLAEQLRRSTKRAIEMLSRYDTSELHSTAPKRDTSHIPIQSILLADRIVRCTIIENGLKTVTNTSDNRLERVTSELTAYSTRVIDHILPSSFTIQELSLSPREITLRAGLCLQEIQFRDAFASHVASKQGNPISSGRVAVDWEYQLKYRMDDATTVGHECHVEINTLNIPYGFNYVNPHTDVVVTPSSFRSLFSMFACIRHAQGCVLSGPSESGKRTLSTQVSSILGRRNFSATLTSYTHATRLLIGALYAGGTFCANLQLGEGIEDNAALIKTLATTLASIEHAVLTQNQIIGLHRSPVTFVPGTAMFVVFPSSTGMSMVDAEQIHIWTEPLSRFPIVQLDREYVVEALLFSTSFADPRRLAKKLLVLWQQAHLSYNLTVEATSGVHDSPFSFSALKTIIGDAAAQLSIFPLRTQRNRDEMNVQQEILTHDAVLRYFRPRIDAEQFKRLELVAESTFSSASLENEEITCFQKDKMVVPPELQECIDLASRELHFMPRQAMLDSISSLSSALTFSMSTILVGPSGVGKTTTYQVLAKAFELCLQRGNEATSVSNGDSQTATKPQTSESANERSASAQLSNKKSLPSVAVLVVLPMSLTVSQLYGGVSLDGHGRVPSILGQLIREAQEVYVPHVVTRDGDTKLPTQSLLDLHNQVWVVFDGALDLRWLEGLLAVLSKPKGIISPLLAFQDGEFMTLPPNLRFMFEVLELRDVTPRFLHLSAILHMNGDIIQETTPKYEPESKMNISTAYLHRYLVLQRERIMQREAPKSQTGSTADTFNLIEKWLINSSLLDELHAVFDAGTSSSTHLSPLLRVTNLITLLQSLISTASALPDSTRTDSSGAISEAQFNENISTGQIRVEMALMYSLIWGFAACTGDHVVIQRQVSDVLRREFEHLTPAWINCDKDVNLFETLLDLQNLRFVSVVRASGQVALPPQVSNSFSSLYIPTSSSLVVHATIKEALRSGRGVLLLGGNSSRRTTLARNFFGQLDVIRSIIAAGGVSKLIKEQPTDDDKTQKTASKSIEAATLASVKRLRLRQITLVTFMTMRLQKDTTGSEDGPQYSRNTSPSITADNRSIASVVEEEEGVPLSITPSTDLTKTAMVRQFDRGDVIPFFFTMPHGNASTRDDDAATELANCLERMLQRERTGLFEPPPGKTALLILDDLHVAIPPERENSKALYPSVYAYLRSVQEHKTVYRGASCLPISVENLMMLATMHRDHFMNNSREESLRKLTTQLFPVLAPSCELQELHNIFGQALQTHWDVSSSSKTGTGTISSAVRHAIPLVVAATTLLWDRVRATYKYCLQDLARVYEGLAFVGPPLLADVETLLRLWTHENCRILREPSMGFCSSQQDGDVTEEIARMRSLVSQVTQRRASARASRLSISTGSLSFAPKRQSVVNQPVNDEISSPAALLGLFATQSSGSTGKTLFRPSPQFNSIQEQQHRAVMVGGLWAFVPSSVYYGGAAVLVDEGQNISTSGESTASTRAFRRSSVNFMRRKSMETAAGENESVRGVVGRSGRWIYAEISFEDDIEAVSTGTMQAYFRDLRTFSSTTMTLYPSGSKKTTGLPQNVPPVPFKLALSVVRIDRVLARPAARLVLLDNNGSGVDTLLRYATVSRISDDQPADSAIFTFSGLVDDSDITTRIQQCLTLRWKRILLELYERVGVAGQEATLVIKRLDLLPMAIINQIQALITTGEVPGTLSLEEQVHLATRVCDERLLALKTKHAAQVAQIRLEAEATRDQALAVLHQKQRDAPTMPMLEQFQQVEMRYQRELRSKLACVDLRWQQDSDDLRRQREVESESVAATVMALTRPLGVTSGKWASAVSRMCSKLRVILLVDKQHEKRVRTASPNVFAICDVVSVPQLDRDSLRTLVYGHFYSQVHQLLVTSNALESTEDGGLADFFHQTLRSLWSVVCMATDMHRAVVEAFSTEKGDGTYECPSTTRAFTMATFFVKLIVEGYKREEAAQSKAAWFLDLSNRLDRDLGALRSSDVLLSEQLTTIDQQLVHHEAKLVEQKQDAERIRLIMQRLQTTADEQIIITNEAQESAQRELREPMACLEEANRALLLVDRRHIVEIKSFVSPPPLVHLVLGAVCVLFQLEPSWESARRLLLGDANVVQTLLQFNKDAVSAVTLARLESDYLIDERFCREEVERQSVAAASMVGWVRAIYQYATARHQVQPTLDKLEKAQSRLQLIMQEFQVSKQRVVEADEAWKTTQAAIDAAITRKEILTSEISSLDARCDSGGIAMEALKEDRKLQQEAANASSMRRGFALTTWNTLLSAGALAYACELSLSSRRDRVFRAWEAAYFSYGGLTPNCPPTSTRCSFIPSIAVVLKDEENQSRFDEHETPLTALFSGDYPKDENVETEKLVVGVGELGFSRRRLWDASLLSMVATTPTLPVLVITRFSPELEELLVSCARRVWYWNQLHMAYARAPDFDDMFREAARLGRQLLVLDVEPIHSEPTPDENARCLNAAFSWKTKCIDDADHLLLRRKSPEADDEEYTASIDDNSTDSIELHPNFRLILTSNASRAAFGEALDMFPTLDAYLHPNDMADVMVDKLWSSSAINSIDVESSGKYKLKTALKEHGMLAQQYEASHAQLTKLLETAAMTSQFPLSQTKALRDRLASIQEARQVLSDKRCEIQEQLRLVKRQCTPIARTGATVFNAFNSTISGAGPNASPPLTPHVFLPMLLDAVCPSPTSTASPAPIPMLNDTKRRSSSIRRLGVLARGASSFALSTSLQGQSRSNGVPSDVLTNLLSRMVPLIPLNSPNEDWYGFLLQVIIALDEIQPGIQSLVPQSVDEHETGVEGGDLTSPRSFSTILLQAKLKNGSTTSSFITAETCKTIITNSSRSDLQRRVVSTILNGFSEAGDIDGILRLALPETSSRSDRLRVSLILFPELVHHVCDRVLGGFGVPQNFRCRGPSITNSSEAEDTAQGGSWLRTIRALPEETIVMVLTRHEFHSFGFARRVFFHGLEGSASLQIRVLQTLGERKFRSPKEDEALTTLNNIDSEQSVALSQMYIFPQSVNPDEGDQEVKQLLLMLEHFKQIIQMEKTQLEMLEKVPLAVINMTGNTGVAQHWEALFQILYRSIRQTSSTAFQRHNIHLNAGAGETLVKRPSIVERKKSAIDSSTSLTANSALVLSNSTARTSISQPSLLRSGTTRRASTSQSMVKRLSAVDLVTPTYPRLVAAVDNLRAVPIHLRSNIVCFRDEYEDETSASSLNKCLQRTILRLVMYPSIQTLCELVQPAEDDAVRPPVTYFWQVLSGLVLFHATLVFRSNVLTTAYGEFLPPTHYSAIFHYSDDAFLTAINQFFTTIVEKKQHSRRTEKVSEQNAVLERRIYQQVVLGSYTRLAVGHQEVEFLRKLFSECFRLVTWTSTGDNGNILGSLQSFQGRSRQMSIRGNLRDPSGVSPAVHCPSMPLLKGPSTFSVVNSWLRLGFLAFPSESLRQADLSLDQWLELIWSYSTNIDEQMVSNLQTLLLGCQQSSHNRRSSFEDTSRDLLATSSGPAMAKYTPPKWMWAFGWTNANHGAILGDELAWVIPLQDVIDVLEAIVAEALPPRFEPKSKHELEHEPGKTSSRGEHRLADQAMITVYNHQIGACALALETLLTHLHDIKVSSNAIEGALFKSDGVAEEDHDDHDENSENEDKDDNHFRLSDIEDKTVRQQIISILRNEIPPGFSRPSTTRISWSLHGLFQHYQDWYKFLNHVTNPSQWWLPGILETNLPLTHILQTSIHFTLRAPESTTQLPATFAIIDGIVLVGAKWNENSQSLEQIDNLQLQHQRVQLVCFLSKPSNDVSAIPLLGYDGSLLLECPLAVDQSRMPLVTPFLIPLGSFYR